MSPPQIIGLVGPAGCGKTTLARMLHAKAGYQLTSFSGPLKAMMAALLCCQGCSQDMIERMLYGNLKEMPTPYLAGCTPRRAMQTLGTEWRDTLKRDLWSQIWRKKVENTPGRFVADDCRFIHETKTIHALNGIVVTVRRPALPRPTSLHLSETEYQDIIPDVLVINSEGDASKMWDQLLAALPGLKD